MSPKKVLSSSEINFYKKQGYLVKKELISESIIDKINQKIKNLIQDKKKVKYFEFLKFDKKKYCVRLKDPHQVDQVFSKILKDKKIMHIVSTLLGGGR